MYDANAMRRSQSTGHGLEHIECLADLHRRVAPQSLTQRLPSEKLHHQVQEAVVLAVVEDGDRVGVLDKAGGAGFALKALGYAILAS